MSWSERDDPLPRDHPERRRRNRRPRRPGLRGALAAAVGPRPKYRDRDQQAQAPSTQSRHPWRASVRTAFAAAIGLLSLLPVAATTAGVEEVPAVAQVLVVTTAVTRVLALPQVEAWLRRYVPWLAPEGKAEGRPPDLTRKAADPGSGGQD